MYLLRTNVYHRLAKLVSSIVLNARVACLAHGTRAAVKLARRWAYDVKKVKPNAARVVFARGNFWGRSLAAVSASSDPTCSARFGPFMPNFDLIDYNDTKALEKAVSHPDCAAFMVEVRTIRRRRHRSTK